MKKIQLWYFSGTGNTKIVADMIATNFLERGCAVIETKIGHEDGASEAATYISEADLIGIGSPVIGFGTPSLVIEFIKRLPAGNGKKVFIFRTAGGVVPLNYNASHALISLLSKKGYCVFHERLFSIGSNWIIRFSNDAMRKLHEATREKVARMCGEVLEGKARTLSTGRGMKISSLIMQNLSSVALRFVAKDFHLSKECTHCGLCARNCPAGNIQEKKGHMRFGANCASCMRCIYACPKNAIAMRALNFFPVKGGYDVNKILSNPENCPDEHTKKEPPFLKAYLAQSGL